MPYALTLASLETDLMGKVLALRPRPEGQAGSTLKGRLLLNKDGGMVPAT
jgi:hypothetical protein